MKNSNILLFVLVCLLPFCFCIYEDEIGLADWYQAHVGKINTAFFVPPRQLVVATDSSVLASLNIKTGEIIWRQVLPRGTIIDKIHYFEQNILLVSGRRVSVWSIADEGSLRWEEEEEGDVVDAKISENIVSVATKNNIILRSVATGEALFTSPATTPLAPVIVHAHAGAVYAIELREGACHVSSVTVHAPYNLNSHSVTLPTSPFKGSTPVITNEGYVVHLAGSGGKHVVLVHQLKSSSKNVLSFDLETGISAATLSSLGNDSFVIKTSKEQLVFRPNYASSDSFPFKLEQRLSLADSIAAGGKQIAYTSSPPILHYTNKTGTFHRSLPSSPSSIFLLSPSPYVLCVDADWRTSVFALNSLFPVSEVLAPIWKREEALAAVVKTEFVDLPPDVTDLNDLVREFEGDGLSIATRISAQIDHIKHTLGNMGQIINRFADQASSSVVGRKQKLTEKELITKDKFGFRKLIIAVTSSGKVFGVSTDQGQIVWSSLVNNEGFSSNSFVYLTRTSAAYPPEIVLGDATHLYKMNPLTGELLSSSTPSTLLQVIPLPFLYTGSDIATHSPNTHILMLVHSPSSPSSSLESLSVSLLPNKKEATDVFEQGYDKVHFFLINKASSTITGYSFPDKASMRATVSWNVTFAQETFAGIVSHHPHDKVYHPAAVLGDRNILPKYLNRNLIGVATESTSSTGPVLHIYLMDTVTGSIVFHTQHTDCMGVQGKVALVLMEHSLVYTYWNSKTHKHQMSVVDLYTQTIDWTGTQFSSYSPKSPVPLQQSYFLPTPVSLLTHTSSARGITAKHLLLGLASDSVVSLDKRWADARRPKPTEITPEQREENLIPYHPRLFFAPTSYVTYNKTVHRLSAIVTSGAALESTTLVLAVGLDLFFTRLSPAEAYDILTSDFNYPALILTITLLCIATCVTSRLGRRKDLLRAWK